jgi:3-hydroxyacyl-CoA dehydrogenase
LRAAFVVTGGLGSIGAASAKLLVSKGAYAVVSYHGLWAGARHAEEHLQLFDILPAEKAKERIASFDDADKYFYFQADISSRDSMEGALSAALKVIPKGSLFGAVHCAAVNPNVPWPTKMSDKLKVS